MLKGIKHPLTTLKKIRRHFLRRKYLYYVEGYCYCCGQKVFFYSDDHWLRDNLKCSNCNSIPRERALMYCLEIFFPDWRNYSIHESSPAARGASLKIERECKNYVKSFYGPRINIPVQGNALDINLEEQSFGDESFNIVVTQDVLEHIFKPEKAFKEIARTLKKKGAHVFTVPLVNKDKPTEKWAELVGNKINWLRTPEYHGDPINSDGSPVAYHWGYDIVNFISRISNLDTTIVYIDNWDLGIRAEYIEVLISRKAQ
jgi:hypothetical protein